MAFHTVLTKGILSDVLEWEHILADHSDEKEKSREEPLSAIRSESYESAGSFAWY